jgi:hypothetical protein
MDALSTLTPEAKALVHEADTALTGISAIRVTTPEECQGLVDQLKDIKTKAKKLEEIRFSMTRPIDAAKQAIMDFFRGPAEVLAKCETVGKAEISRWNAEQARIAAAAEAERRRQEALERERLAEEQRQAEALLAQADAAMEAGDVEAAEKLEAQAAHVQEAATPICAPVNFAPVKAKGTSSRKIWKCRVTNPDLVPREYWMINADALDAFAKAMKENARLPGCEFTCEDCVSIR